MHHGQAGPRYVYDVSPRATIVGIYCCAKFSTYARACKDNIIDNNNTIATLSIDMRTPVESAPVRRVSEFDHEINHHGFIILK